MALFAGGKLVGDAQEVSEGLGPFPGAHVLFLVGVALMRVM